MQLSRILSACTLNGVIVEKVRENYYVLTKGENRLTMHVQDGYVGHLTYHSPMTDAMTDCFCDSYFSTIKSAMQHLNPTGELIKASKVGNDVPTVTDVVISKNEEKNGIEIRFPGKPSNDVITELKNRNYRWSPFNSVWWKKFNESDYKWAIDTFAKEPEEISV